MRKSDRVRINNEKERWGETSCIGVRVTTRPSTKLDKFCLPKVTKALKIFKPLLHSISKEQPIRPVMYGVKHWSLCRNSLVCLLYTSPSPRDA